MTTTVYSNHVEAEARKLLANRHQWAWARNKETGVAYVAVPSGAKVYQVHPRGLGCNCEATQKWNAPMCKHRRAVQMANAEDAAAEQSMPAIRVVRGRFEDLFPSCRVVACYDVAEGRDGYCSKCGSDREWTARMAARRTSVEREQLAQGV